MSLEQNRKERYYYMLTSKTKKIIIAFILSILWIVSILFFLYSINAFKLQNKVVTQTRTPIKTTQTADTATIARIKRLASTNDVSKLQKRGLISVPSVGIFEPIYNDAYSNYGLKYGANQVMNNQATSLPNFGINNVVIASHNYSDGKTGFSPLQQNVNRNDPYITNGIAQTNKWLNNKPIYLANSQGVYVYKITEQYIAKLSNRQPLNQSKHAELTLLTCLEPNDSFRLITKAKLIEAYPWDKAPNKIINYFNPKINKMNVQK